MEDIVRIDSCSLLKDFRIVIAILERYKPLWVVIILAYCVMVSFHMHILFGREKSFGVMDLSTGWASSVQVFCIEECRVSLHDSRY